MKEPVISTYNKLKEKAVALKMIGEIVHDGCHWDSDELENFLTSMPECLQEETEILSAIEQKLYDEIFNN